jgi:hypothetical protein
MTAILSSINVGEELKGRLVVKVTLARSFMWRMTLAAYLLRVVALISPLTVEVEDTEEGESKSL